MSSIDRFKANISGGGARANQYMVTFGSVAGAVFEQKTQFLVKTTQLPGQTITEIPVNFRGRILNLVGDRTFNPWSITVLNDTDFKIYRGLERWMNGMNNMTDNEGLTNPVDYQVDAFVDHLDRNGNNVKSYTLRGLFPTEIGGIDLSMGEATEIETFGVTFEYQYFETNTTT